MRIWQYFKQLFNRIIFKSLSYFLIIVWYFAAAAPQITNFWCYTHILVTQNIFLILYFVLYHLCPEFFITFYVFPLSVIKTPSDEIMSLIYSSGIFLKMKDIYCKLFDLCKDLKCCFLALKTRLPYFLKLFFLNQHNEDFVVSLKARI